MNTPLKPKATILDIDELMDMKIDEVPTLPDYVTPPPGLYYLLVKDCVLDKYDVKEDGKATGEKANRIKIVYEVAKTVAVMEGEHPVPDKSLFSETFQGTSEGIQYFKKAAMNILSVTSFEGATNRDVMDGIKGVEFKANITVRKSSKDGKNYENLMIRAANPVVATD